MGFKCIVTSLALLLSACGSGGSGVDAYTWEDSVVEVADSFCLAVQRCAIGDFDDEAVAGCQERSYQICEPSCDVPVTDAGIADTRECVEALDAIEFKGSDECLYLVYFNQIPKECQGWLDLAEEIAKEGE